MSKNNIKITKVYSGSPAEISGLSKGDIMGFLCQKGGLEKSDIGRIDVKEHYSFVAVNRQKTRALLKKIEGQKIKGMKTLFQPTK